MLFPYVKAPWECNKPRDLASRLLGIPSGRTGQWVPVVVKLEKYMPVLRCTVTVDNLNVLCASRKLGDRILNALFLFSFFFLVFQDRISELSP